MRTLFVSIMALLALVVTSRVARADEPVKAKGLVVIATDGTTDATWPLARAVYGSELLRPRVIDDAHARVLAGEPAPDDAELKELAELRAGIKGDDAASRQLLSALSEKLHVVGVVVVFPNEARLYDAEKKAFDAAHYTAEKDEWKSAARSLERWYAPGAAPPIVTLVPKEPEPMKPPVKSKAFYETPWFWAAIGAVLLIGGGVLIATNVQTSDTIHMQLRLP